MKIIKECLIDGKEYDLSHCHIVLELNNAGRGFIVIESDENLAGRAVEINVGEAAHFYQYFNGVIEHAQDDKPKFKKCFIREKVAIFEGVHNCSIRHATLNDICAYLQSKTGITFKIPSQPYATTPIPNFTHSGSGYQLLNNLGRLFNIPDYLWQQGADGTVFVGSYQDSRWYGKNIEIDSTEALDSSNNRMTLPIYSAIRPGALVNQHKITQTELINDELILQWQSVDEKGKPKQKSPQRQMMEKEFPELAGGYHLPRYAKVIGVADPSSGGDIADPFRPKYAVELQVLNEDGSDDTNTPPYSAVPLPVTSTGSQGGDFAFPEVGTIVEIGYAYGRPDKPFVRTLLAQDKTVPSVAIGEQLKQQRPEVFERTDAAGNKTRETDQTITDRSFIRVIETDTETKNIGTSQSNIDADKQINVGGNYSLSVIGNITTVTAGNNTTAIDGTFKEQISGIAERCSDVLIKLQAPAIQLLASQINIGSGKQNILNIMEETIQIVADLANTVASHTHNGGSAPDQSSTFNSYNNRALAEKGKLTPIIEK
ncbi:hypothetical protein HBL79_00850 [Avibacterium paragallinarum]|uniref:hypothetical protein n=1 Tax=Avibacterium paragallinarum TaxID=728 RepID=UPI00021ACC5C|nr:hypothetical protein [Avibacterium paragallinarum]QIR10927.1 hypothetical protein HBL79_00850 [Avibacterium paragallinarum]